jgi:MFS family permease
MLWHVLLAASLSSMLGAFGLPAAQAFTFDLVGRERLVNAVGLGFLSFNIASILGPALAGAVIQRWGIGEAYLAVAAVQWTAAVLLLLIRSVRVATPQASSLFEGVQGLLSLLRGHAQLRRLVLLSVVVEAFAYSYIVILPAMARDVLGMGPAGFGLLAAVAGVGASVGSLGVAALGNMRHKSLAVLIGAGGFGLFLVLFSLSRGFALAAPLIALVGAATALYNVALSSLLQLLVPEGLRGRAMGLYIFTWGFMLLGGFPLGAVARWLSVPAALALGGGLVVAYTLARGRALARIREPVGSPTGLS